MNEELTNEVLEEMKKCSGSICSECLAADVCTASIDQRLATALLEERAQPKVWDSIHTTVDKARIIYYAGDKCLYDKEYTRELPKTRARIMAEEIASANISNKDDLIDIIEQTINAHMEELKGEA